MDSKYSPEDDIDEFFVAMSNQKVAPPSNLTQRIVGQLPDGQLPADPPPAPSPLAWLLPSPWRMAASLLLPLVFGFGMGFGDLLSDEPEYEIETLLFADTLTSEPELLLDIDDEY